MSNTTILIVDDEPQIHQLVSLSLRKMDCTVQGAQDGEQALTIIRDEYPDLVLLDLMMPGMTGEDVLDALQADESTSRIPVIIFSAIAKVRYNSKEEWPSQVVDVLDKANLRPVILRELVEKYAMAGGYQ